MIRSAITTSLALLLTVPLWLACGPVDTGNGENGNGQNGNGQNGNGENGNGSPWTRDGAWMPDDAAAWYAADHDALLFSDVAGTQPAAVGDTIRRWGDSLGNENADARRDGTGITRSSVGGRPSLHFDGGRLQASNVDVVNAVPALTIVAIYHGLDLPHSADLWSASTTNASQVKATLFRSTLDGENKGVGGRRLDGDSFRSARAPGTIENGRAHVLIGVLDYQSGTIELYANDAETPIAADTFASSGASSGNDAANVWIGTKHGLEDFRFFGHFHELVIYQRAITPAERTDIVDHARDFWGVP